MNGRRSLTTLGLSLLLHALLVLAIGFFLSRPTRIIQHIEVDLGTTGAAVHPEKETPAAQPSPAPTPDPPEPKPEPTPKPVPKPAVKPPEQKPKPRTITKQPEAIKVEETTNTKTIETTPDTAQKESTEVSETNTKEETGSINTPAADNTHSGGQKTDASALQAYLAAIRARIAKAKRYPMMAERRRIQGEVVVSFRLSFDGRLLGEPQVSESSGSSLLDGAAVRAVMRAAPFPRFPGPADDMLTEPLSVELDFVIR